METTTKSNRKSKRNLFDQALQRLGVNPNNWEKKQPEKKQKNPKEKV